MTYDQVRQLLLRKCKPFSVMKDSSGLYGWCREHNVARSHASEFLTGKRNPPPDLLEALGLEWRVMRKPSHPGARNG